MSDDNQDPNLNNPADEVIETPEEAAETVEPASPDASQGGPASPDESGDGPDASQGEPTEAEANDPENQSPAGSDSAPTEEQDVILGSEATPESNSDDSGPTSQNEQVAVTEEKDDAEPAGPRAEEANESTGEETPTEPTDETAPAETPTESDSAPAEEASTEPDEPLSEENQATQDDIDSLSSDTTNDNPNARWFVVHTYSGHENKVATALKQRVESEHLEHKILDVIVPTQDKIEIRSGKKATVKEKIFPGYILVKMDLDDNSWLAVRTTQGVTGFVGIGNKPTPIPEAEVKTIVKFMTQGAAPTFKDVFMVDDTVKIVDGPFSEFIGKVDSVDKEKGKVRVLVSIFGRETPVELDFLQVQKL